MGRPKGPKTKHVGINLPIELHEQLEKRVAFSRERVSKIYRAGWDEMVGDYEKRKKLETITVLVVDALRHHLAQPWPYADTSTNPQTKA